MNGGSAAPSLRLSLLAATVAILAFLSPVAVLGQVGSVTAEVLNAPKTDATATGTPTSTPTVVNTATRTAVPTATATSTATAIPTATAVAAATATGMAADTPTATVAPADTSTPAAATPTATAAATDSATPSPSPTATATAGTPTASPTATATQAPTATDLPVPATLVPPSNDDFGSAREIGGFPFTEEQDILGATDASDDPSMEAGSGQNSGTVWFWLRAPGNGTVRVNTLGSDYDTVLAVFTGSRGDLELVASNDDSYPGCVQSEVAFDVKRDVAYYVEVAQWGGGGGGSKLKVAAEFMSLPTATPTYLPVVVPLYTSTPLSPITPTPDAAGAILAPATLPSMPPAVARFGPVPADQRYFAETGYRVNLDPFWDYFQKRGGVRTFGHPISREFTLLGFQVQFFQRGILHLMPDGGVATMNLLDDGLMPYSRINFSVFPEADQKLIEAAPSSSDPNYGEEVMAFLAANVPDLWEGMPVGFLQTYLSTVRYEDAFPNGDGEQALVPLLNLELWGLPTAGPARDPGNHDFVYQRFQRGILHWDASSGAVQGLLLADYLKSIINGEGLPPDLELQARGSRFYRQLDRQVPGHLARPQELAGTNLEGAFEREVTL